jgi:DNA-directed RNA polymerase specialized sigma24 family protein
MVTRTHLDKGVAILATLWGVQPSDVANRLAIQLDFSNLSPTEIGKRAARALRSQNHKHHLKKHRARKIKPLNPQTMHLLSDPAFFKSLRSKLLKYAKSKISYTPDAEDLVSDTILTTCTYHASSYDHLTAIALNTLKKAITSYFHKQYNSTTPIQPHEDFFYLEESLNLCEETSDHEPTHLQPTSDTLQAFTRIAAELIHQLGLKHAASSLNLRTHTLSNILSL